MKLLTFTSVFPNSIQPHRSMFNYHRLVHFARIPGNSAVVVAPVPYAPAWVPLDTWRCFSRVTRHEVLGDIAVHHPRYLLIPKISMTLHGWLMSRGSAKVVADLHLQERFDCIDAQYVYPDGFAAVRLGRTLGLPVMVNALGTDINVFPSLRTIRPLILWTLRNAAGIAAVSESLKLDMIKLGIQEERIRVIANGVDTGRFQPVDRNTARTKLGIRHDVPAIVAVGNLVPGKGFQLLVEAVAELASGHPTVETYIVGEGAYRSELQRLIDGRDLTARMHLVGSRPNDELPAWFSAADISCLPSAGEGQPNVVLESMACGTPVVATKVGGIPELITSSEFGVLLDRDVDALAAAIHQALIRNWDRAKIAAHGRKRSWADVANEVEQYFRERCAAAK